MTWFEFTMGNICWLSFLSTENFTFRVVPQRELEDAVLKQESWAIFTDFNNSSITFFKMFLDRWKVGIEEIEQTN